MTGFWTGSNVQPTPVSPPRFPWRAPPDVLRLGALAAALALHGAFGVPAPPGLRSAELASALALLLAVGVRRPLAALGAAWAGRTGPSWMIVGIFSFIWLLWVPLLRGVAMGHGAGDIVRDVVPLVFLFLPLLLGPAFAGVERAAAVLAAGLGGAGVLFALRWLAADGTPVDLAERYLPNDPAVPFAAVLLPACAAALLAHPGAGRRLAWPAAALLAASGAAALAALVAGVHRAAGVAAVLALCGLWVFSWRTAPVLHAAGTAVGAAALWFSREPIGRALGAFAQKTELVGLNGRQEELAEVFRTVTTSWDLFLFGTGWGGLFANPAVGGWWVSYVHSLPGYLLLKTGLTGCIAAAAWAGTLIPLMSRVFLRRPVLGAAVLVPLLVGAGVHTGYKYFTFGLLLGLLVLADTRGRPVPHDLWSGRGRNAIV